MVDVIATEPHNFRPEICSEPANAEAFGVVERRLTLWEQLYGSGPVRKAFILLILAVVWEVYGRSVDNSLLFPTFGETASALVSGLATGDLLMRIWTSLQVLLMGYAIGIVAAAVLTIVAISTRLGEDFMVTLTAMFSPLPAIALLPLALIWFGLGAASLVFVLVHSVLWAVALNTFSGFQSTSRHATHGGSQLRLEGVALCQPYPDPGRTAEHCYRSQDRVGLRLANIDSGRDGVWRQFRAGRARLVHLSEQEHARHSRRLCWPSQRHSHRSLRRGRALQAA